jgi:hypothetical protein
MRGTLQRERQQPLANSNSVNKGKGKNGIFDSESFEYTTSEGVEKTTSSINHGWLALYS